MCSVYNKPEDVAYDYSLFRPQKEMFFLWSWIINDILLQYSPTSRRFYKQITVQSTKEFVVQRFTTNSFVRTTC
jgi:hypothetical protein